MNSSHASTHRIRRGKAAGNNAAGVRASGNRAPSLYAHTGAVNPCNSLPKSVPEVKLRLVWTTRPLSFGRDQRDRGRPLSQGDAVRGIEPSPRIRWTELRIDRDTPEAQQPH